MTNKPNEPSEPQQAEADASEPAAAPSKPAAPKVLPAPPPAVKPPSKPTAAKAPEAAGEIHSDMERGFIRAETIAYDDYVSLGGENAAKEAGKLRQEGKDYVVQDGDVLHFKFNV